MIILNGKSNADALDTHYLFNNFVYLIIRVYVWAVRKVEE